MFFNEWNIEFLLFWIDEFFTLKFILFMTNLLFGFVAEFFVILTIFNFAFWLFLFSKIILAILFSARYLFLWRSLHKIFLYFLELYFVERLNLFCKIDSVFLNELIIFDETINEPSFIYCCLFHKELIHILEAILTQWFLKQIL